MIRVYNGDACAVQESEYDWRTALRFFLNGHRDEYILIYRDDKPIKTLSYRDICYNREVPEKIIYLDQDVFAEARKYFFTYREQEERWMRAVAVCNRQEEVECILYYQHNPITTGHPVSEFEEYEYDEELDFEFLSRADTYIFEEYEEYAAFIYDALERRFPEKEKYFLDENAQIFLGSESCCQGNGDFYVLPGKSFRLNGIDVAGSKRIAYIDSSREQHFMSRAPQTGVYSSLGIMTSLFWRQKECSYGDLNPDKKFMLIRFPLYSCGLGDIIRFCMTKAAVTEYLRTEYIPVIDLSVPDDGNQFTNGRPDNVWEYYFKPLNEYSVEEVMQSSHVLICDEKMDSFNPYMMEQYHDVHNMRMIYGKYLRLNQEMSSYVNEIKKQFFSQGEGTDEKKVLGVIARGTDFRYGGFDIPRPMEDEPYIELVRRKMDEWGCDSFLLATEDMDILEHFRQAGFGKRMRYIEQDRYRYTDVGQPGLVVAKMKKEGHDYRDELPYLAVLYLLADCDSLITNCRCGAFIVADYINGGAYEHRYCCGEGDC